MKTKKKTLEIRKAREEKQWRQSIPAFFVLAKAGFADYGMDRSISAR